MPFKVLNNDGDKIIVDTINPQIHKHLSGREFTEDDACVHLEVEEERMDQVRGARKEWIEEERRDQTIEAYTEKYGRKPSSRMKTENIIAKL